MTTYTLDELSKKLGIVRPHLLRYWREGKEVEGKRIDMEEVDGEKVWSLVTSETTHDVLRCPQCGAKKLDKSGAGLVVCPAAADCFDPMPMAQKRLKDGRPFEAVRAELNDEQAAELTTWAEDEGFVDHPAPVTEITADWLCAIDGVGKKGAENILEWLPEQDITSFADLLAVDDLTDLPAIGKKNGANLRAALLEQAGGDTLVEITCPWCDGLFDEAPAGSYDTDWADCEADGVADRGDCGKSFWLEATDDGYQTHQSGPDESDVSEETDEDEDDDLAADGGEVVSIDDGKEATPNNPFGVPKNTHNPFAKPRRSEPTKQALVAKADRPHPALTDCTVLGRADHGTDAWHNLRAQGIGSSDAGAILGLSPHATAVDVWETKTGGEPDKKPWLEPYADFGSWFEPYLREWCEEQHGIDIIDGAEIGTLKSARWGRALANIDGLDTTHGKVEEYKTTTEKWTSIPAQYDAQCQEQMLVTGVDEVRLRQFVCPIPRKHVPSLLDEMRTLDPSADQTLADWLLERGEVHTWIVERDEKYIERMLERLRKFWTFVEMEIEPTEADPEGTVDLTDDPEVYAACTEYARLDELFETQAMRFLEAEGIEPSKRGSVSGTAEKALKKAKKRVRKAIEKAVALKCDTDDRPKRVSIGDHHATFVDRGSYQYWNIYTGENDAVDF